MKKTLSFFVLAVILLLSTVTLFAQRIGAPYDSREPHKCANMSQPVKGAISPAQAKQYLQCRLEGVSSQQLFLVEDLSVTVGKGTVFQARNFPYDSDIDPTYPVYPIRATYTQYQCGLVSAIMENKGKNATRSLVEKAEGVCVRTTFGDWRCTVTGGTESNTIYNVAPPK